MSSRASTRDLGGGHRSRALLQASAGAGALLLRFLEPVGALIFAAVLLPFNLYSLPRLFGSGLPRAGEKLRRLQGGVWLHALTVSALVAVFCCRLEVAAATWGIVAAGDGAAGLLGSRLGGPRLPWNGEKSWAGSAVYFLLGAAACVGLLLWTAPGRYAVGFAWAAATLTALYAAALDSLPARLDDVVRVTPLAALFLFAVLLTDGSWPALLTAARARELAIGSAIGAAVAAGALAARLVRPSGAAAGAILAGLLWAGLGARGLVLFLLFFALGSAFTRIGYGRKAAARVAEARGGRRGARNAVANAGVPAACALLAVATPYPELFTVAFAGALAAAAADTAESELGMLGSGRSRWSRTVLVTSFRSVPRGTDGGVSVAGTIAGLAVAALMAAAGAALGLYPPALAVPVAAAGILATVGESVLGATLERRGLLDNEWVNFANGHLGALFAVGFAII